MSREPYFFENVRLNAARRWDQLEGDPELAGPWRQLFRQVQSPRHVLSELLQNADDAGATEASVRIQDDVFIFEHNGEDFSEAHFASLCRFGYSNKRSLHTIGFRGIGFKSIFSLGDRVELISPSLSVYFDRDRFTLPHWLDDPSADDLTRVGVRIADPLRQREVEKNLEDWIKSPLSLLFFKNVRRISLGDKEIHWKKLGPGPVVDSEWMALDENSEEGFILIRSKAEDFPEDALAEIRQERMLGVGEETDFPPCRVELVLGAPGRLYVVLPTGVETELPFACNAPFIQDPARLKVKDPEISPTNRWLLQRAGRLAASAMLDWLGDATLAPEERARAYELLPDVDREKNTLDGQCGTIVELALADAIENAPFLLTDAGELVQKQASLILPNELLEIWEPAQAVALFDETQRAPLCRDVSHADREKFVHWRFVESIDKAKVLEVLQRTHPPKPATWGKLLTLWAFLAPELTAYRFPGNANASHIVPVQGRDTLYAANEVVRLGEKKLLGSDDDWEFLAQYLIVLNPNWTRYIAEQKRGGDDVEGAFAILKKIGLEDASDVNKVIGQVGSRFFSKSQITLDECVRLTQIAAKLDVSVGLTFRFVSRDMKLQLIQSVTTGTSGILVDEDGQLETLIPADRRDSMLLHQAYSSDFKSCSREDWLKWISSGRSTLQTFPQIGSQARYSYSRRSVEDEAERHGLRGPFRYAYTRDRFEIEDWDFEEIYWIHWTNISASDPLIWVIIVDRLLRQRETYWSRAKSAGFYQISKSGYKQSITFENAIPSWVLRLRELPCLPDTRNVPRKPGDLLRRTPETESLLDIEPFVHGLLDRETTRPLLALLGVQDTPAGPDRLLDRLRSLAKAQKPPLLEVEKLYHRLDQMAVACSTEQFEQIKQAFRSERLIFTQDDAWTSADNVFLFSDEEDAPGAAVIRPSVADLALWRRIDVPERPTVDLAVAWLKTLPSGTVLTPQDARRVQSLLGRHPVRIWQETAHWLNLAGEWAPTKTLAYALTMQSLVTWKNLHPWVRQTTADLRNLRSDVACVPPFSEIAVLAVKLSESFQSDRLVAVRSPMKGWLRTLAMELVRIELDQEDERDRVRALAQSLARTDWIEAETDLEVMPYLEGLPAGTPRRVDVLWSGDGLYVTRMPKGKLARCVPEEVGKTFARADIKAALDYSFDRSPEDVRDYLAENFTLAQIVAPLSATTDSEAQPTKDDPTPTDEGEDPEDDVADEQSGAPTSPDDAPVVDGEPDHGTEAGAGDDHETHHPKPRQPHDPKPPKPSLIERFAKSRGFHKDGDGRFFRDDGAWIGRMQGSTFPWGEWQNGSGEPMRCYLPIEKCLEVEPIELKAEAWSLLEKRPALYAVLAAGVDESVMEFTGLTLTEMRDRDEIKIFPATYRLVQEPVG